MDACTFWQDLPVQLLHGGMHTFQHLRGILATQHLHDALHAVGIVSFRIGEAQHTLTLQVTIFKGTYIVQIDRYTPNRLDHDASQVLQVLYQANATDHVGEITAAQHATTSVHVVLLDLLRDVRQGHVILLHLVGIHLDLILGSDASVVAHVSDSRHLL